MNNINIVNKNKLEAIKGLTPKQIRLALLNLWNNYYTILILKMNIKKAYSYLKQINFIMENANTDEWYKVDKNKLIANIEAMPNEIAIELRYDTISLSKSLNNMVLFSIYQNLSTFNKMFSIIKDSLDTLDDNQSFDLANEIVMCRMLIKRANLVNDNNPHIKETDNNSYNDFLKEKKTFISTINSTIFPNDININMEAIRIKINDKLKTTENIKL